MSIAAGDRLGPYEVLAPLGAGGMGEVYRARDTRLKRDVALKVLPEAFGHDSGRMARFQREAEVLASLNHPNIAQIYGTEEHALVMELVDGPTLADRIKLGPIPLDESFEVARQIAEALEAAHEKGIVHRDLKPANVKVRPDGTVKVLDFGLAAILQTSASGVSDPANSPTLTIGATQVGAIMGTAGYMSPEQAVGKPVDRRADIWAFGVVLFEMLTGQHLFTGETASHILADVIKGGIDFGKLPASTPNAIRNLLKRCLDRDVKNRLQWIGEARITIARIGKDAEPARDNRLQSRFGALGWIAAAVLAGAAGWGWWHSAEPAERAFVRLDVDLGADVSLKSYEDDPLSTVVLSPDGMRLVYLASSSGGPPRLFTRRLDQLKATELLGTEGAVGPFFSPDGHWIGFYSRGKLNKVSVEGGAVVPLADVPGFPGGDYWQEDGNIIVTGARPAGAGAGGLSRVPSGGGAPNTVTEPNGDLGHVMPQTLPGGKAILFVAYSTLSPDKAHIDVLTLTDGHQKTIVPVGTSAHYVPMGSRFGYLLYTNRGTLFAIPFDMDRLETRGTAVPILDDVAYQSVSGGAQFAVSRSGTLVYRQGTGAATGMMTVQWLTPGNDGVGKKEPLRSNPNSYSDLRFSPDGTRLAMVVAEQGKPDVWIYDLRRGAMTRLTAGEAQFTSVAWSPDSHYVFFGSLSNGIFWARADGAGEPRPLTVSRALQAPSSVSPNGKQLAYFEISGPPQIWTLPLEESNGQMKAGKAEPFLKSRAADFTPAFSSDGKWLAYYSTATLNNEVFVRAFPDSGGRWQISTSGGINPVWSPNGHDLLYQSGDQIMAVSYMAKGDTFVAEKPRLWLSKIGGPVWDLAPDGKRVAVVTPMDTLEAPKQNHEVVFLQNFFDELRRRVPLGK